MFVFRLRLKFQSFSTRGTGQRIHFSAFDIAGSAAIKNHLGDAGALGGLGGGFADLLS